MSYVSKHLQIGGKRFIAEENQYKHHVASDSCSKTAPNNGGNKQRATSGFKAGFDCRRVRIRYPIRLCGVCSEALLCNWRNSSHLAADIVSLAQRAP